MGAPSARDGSQVSDFAYDPPPVRVGPIFALRSGMTNKTTKKLSLGKLTLKNLASGELSLVVGGGTLTCRCTVTACPQA